jgi:hypothetical protein
MHQSGQQAFQARRSISPLTCPCPFQPAKAVRSWHFCTRHALRLQNLRRRGQCRHALSQFTRVVPDGGTAGRQGVFFSLQIALVVFPQFFERSSSLPAVFVIHFCAFLKAGHRFSQQIRPIGFVLGPIFAAQQFPALFEACFRAVFSGGGCLGPRSASRIRHGQRQCGGCHSRQQAGQQKTRDCMAVPFFSP